MHFLLLLWIGVGNPFKDPTTEATKPYLSNSRPAIPVAIITYSTINGGNSIEDGETVVFDGTSSYDPDGGSITKYRWRINGSLQGTASTFSWTFDIADGSSQSVKLSIWDDENEYREVTETVSVIAGGNQDPVASFAPTGTTVDDDDTVNFTSTSSDSDGTISSTEWFFNALGGTADGTGTTFNWTFDIASGSSQTIYLVVTDNESAKDTTSEVFTVQEAGTQTITRHYYLKDHLGSTRATVDDSGEVVHYADYYPFGMLLPGRSLISSNDEPKELYTGHEHDDETGLYYAGARYYDAMIARWGSVDRFESKYPSLSPFIYTANNPISVVDINGDSLDVTPFDNETRQRILAELSFKSGLALAFSEDGKYIVQVRGLRGQYKKSDAELTSFLSFVLSATAVVTFVIQEVYEFRDQRTQVFRPFEIQYNLEQVQNFVSNTPKGLDARTLGPGMVIMHELIHTELGTEFFGRDIRDPEGTSVVNGWRRSLGPEFGQRQYEFDIRAGEAYYVFTKGRETFRIPAIVPKMRRR